MKSSQGRRQEQGRVKRRPLREASRTATGQKTDPQRQDLPGDSAGGLHATLSEARTLPCWKKLGFQSLCMAAELTHLHVWGAQLGEEVRFLRCSMTLSDTYTR